MLFPCRVEHRPGPVWWRSARRGSDRLPRGVQPGGPQRRILAAAYELPLAVERPAGFYFLQVRVILIRTQAGKAIAQAEQFFFGRQPLSLTEEPLGRVTLPVAWPQIPLEELGIYGVVEPRRP
ncbi:MAG: hypothetical protein FJX77_15670 [Armatimonadetes bacterium]|nr:hypothetical protein [Armatimonadota bacterium]